MDASRGLTTVAVLLAFACSSCSTFYSETRDKQGMAAKEAWAGVDVSGQIATARKNHAALLAKQLETESALARARRDQLARAIATGGTVEDKLAKPVRAALASLAGTRAQADAWLQALADQAFASRSLLKFEAEFKRFGVEMPPCDRLALEKEQAALKAWLAAHPIPAQVVEQANIGAKAACAKPELAAADRFSLPTGMLQSTRDAQVKASAGLADLRARGLAERNAYRAAKAAYDAAAKALEVDPNATRDQLQAAAKKLQEAAETLAALQDVFSVRFLAQEQQDSIDKLLTTIADTPAGAAPAAGSSRAAVALVLLPRLIDATRSSLADAEKPRLVPLLLAKDLAQIRADAAAREIVAQETLVELLQLKLYWLSERTRALRDALINLDGTVRSDGTVLLAALDRPLMSTVAYDALSPVSAKPGADDAAGTKRLDDKIRLWKAASFYLDSEGRLAAEAGKIDYQVNALQHEIAITYAESNIQQWSKLISTSVDQLAAYGAAGIKKEDIVALLNSLTLLWIGKGVN